jgi:single-stranded-DNA-specific exonuclease
VGFAMPAEALPELRRRLNLHAEERLGAKEPEHLLRIHAELPLDRITSVLAGWLKKLEPLGHGNPEPVFVARGARIASAPRIMKDRHIRLDLQQDSLGAGGGRMMRCVGWDWAARCLNMQLAAGSLVDVAYKIRENDHPQYGGVEIEAVGIRPAEA